MLLHPFGLQVLRSFNIQRADVHYFVHDSASYMGPAAERMRSVLMYKNLVHVPCWAHLLDKIGRVVFDGHHLPELVQYLTLTRKLFSRSPFWRRKWIEHQQGAHDEQKQLAEKKVASPHGVAHNNAIPNPIHEKTTELPAIKAMQRGNRRGWIRNTKRPSAIWNTSDGTSVLPKSMSRPAYF